jgi:hypothetical protein
MKASVLAVALAALAFSGTEQARAGIALNTIDALVTSGQDGKRVRSTGPIGCTPGEGIAIQVSVSQAATGARARKSWKARCRGEIQHWQVRARARGAARFANGTRPGVRGRHDANCRSRDRHAEVVAACARVGRLLTQRPSGQLLLQRFEGPCAAPTGRCRGPPSPTTKNDRRRPQCTYHSGARCRSSRHSLCMRSTRSRVERLRLGRARAGEVAEGWPRRQRTAVRRARTSVASRKPNPLPHLSRPRTDFWPPQRVTCRKTRPMKTPGEGASNGHAAAPAFRHERARRRSSPARPRG